MSVSMTTSELADYIVSHQMVAKVVTYFLVLIILFEEFGNATWNRNDEILHAVRIVLKHEGILHVKLSTRLRN